MRKMSAYVEDLDDSWMIFMLLDADGYWQHYLCKDIYGQLLYMYGTEEPCIVDDDELIKYKKEYAAKYFDCNCEFDPDMDECKYCAFAEECGKDPDNDI